MTRVLYTIDGLTGGGAETSLVEIIPDLRQRDVELTIVTLVKDDNALAERVRELGVRTRALGDLGPAARVTALRDEVRSWAPDLVHTSLLWSDLVGRTVGRMTGVPVVTSLVNSIYGPEHRRNSKYGAWSVRCVHAADLVTARMTALFHAVSHQVKSVMVPRLRLPADRVSVVYRGRSSERLGRRSPERSGRVRAELGASPDTPVLLVVGRLDKQKAVEVSLRAAAMVQNRHPELHVWVAGRDGNATAEVHEAARELTNVRLLGHRPDVSDLMAAASCLAFPSRWEGLPGTLIEALALELPVVASDIGPNREVLADIDWPIVALDDAKALAQGIESVLTSQASAVERAVRGRQRFEATFTTSRAADGMLDIYQRAVGMAASQHRTGQVSQ